MPRASRRKKNNRGPATVVCPWCQNPDKLFWPGRSINAHIARCPTYILAQTRDAEEDGAGRVGLDMEFEPEYGEQEIAGDGSMEGGDLGVEDCESNNAGNISEPADDASMNIQDSNTIEDPNANINPLRKTTTRTSRLPSR
ncbi:hypothetical protein MPER_12115 [Moniliophthora perniciosa FA553]|nr:hypothetical protein MPER_12115 [Moniliophthora perniciosa FA553]